MSARAVVSQWTLINKGSLVARADIDLPSGLRLVGCLYFSKDPTRRWVALPSAPEVRSGQVVLVQGKPRYRATVETVDKAADKRLQAVLLDAVDQHIRKAGV